ncbi:hypothetical protein [Leptothoe sp. PORK10 BA2]|uniref:hypothetical protein n=1 Tax=Leptothoe sp. PORK10 BA2 TaxID=3110254 RepID=UPI002B20E901|nr:hypothetical protein [Leptothoe sp. PORK10 BA2]MEA5463324.1 hypothetical protein [Leptothoe sp. PORK10 BA2]
MGEWGGSPLASHILGVWLPVHGGDRVWVVAIAKPTAPYLKAICLAICLTIPGKPSSIHNKTALTMHGQGCGYR